MKKIPILALAITLTMTALAAQDPLTALPESYKQQFENEWVRVVRVHYGPHAKLPAHAHNALPAAYVYLNDSGPVLFKHIGTSYGAATRPPTKTGSFRIYRGLEEIHEVENTSERPSDFLRVEFKTDPRDLPKLRGRYFRPTAPEGQNLEHVQFENEQVRITHLVCAPGRSLRLSAPAPQPALLIAFAASQLRDSGVDLTMRPGQERWLPAGSTTTLENAGSDASEFLRFDFKTGPLTSSVQR